MTNAFLAVAAVRKNLTIRAFSLNGVRDASGDTSAVEKYVRESIDALELIPIISKSFRFDQIADAHRHVESDKQIGKVVVTL